GIELDFIACGDAEEADLVGGVFNGDKTDALFERQRTGGDLGTDDEGERTRLRTSEVHTEFARVGGEAPERDGRGVGGLGDVGDRRTGRDGEDELAEFTLRGSDGSVMRTLDDTSRRHVELMYLGVEDGLLAFHIASARFPGDP